MQQHTQEAFANLCTICQGILQPSNEVAEAGVLPRPGWNIRYQGRTGLSLESMSKSGCQLCMQFWESLDSREKARILDKETGLACRAFWNEEENKFRVIHIYLEVDDRPELFIIRKFELFTDIG